METATKSTKPTVEEFLLFIKEYLEEQKPALVSKSRYSTEANLIFDDETYGLVAISFIAGKNGSFHYYAHSEKFAKKDPRFEFAPASKGNMANVRLRVRYTEKNITKHYYICVG